jgi:hypothetical protein
MLDLEFEIRDPRFLVSVSSRRRIRRQESFRSGDDPQVAGRLLVGPVAFEGHPPPIG